MASRTPYDSEKNTPKKKSINYYFQKLTAQNTCIGKLIGFILKIGTIKKNCTDFSQPGCFSPASGGEG